MGFAQRDLCATEGLHELLGSRGNPDGEQGAAALELGEVFVRVGGLGMDEAAEDEGLATVVALEGDPQRRAGGGQEGGRVGGDEGGDAEVIEGVDGELGGGLAGAGDDGGFEGPAAAVAAEADAEAGGRGGLEVQRAGLEDGTGEKRVGAEIVGGEPEAAGEALADDVDALAVRREEVEPEPVLGEVADLQAGLLLVPRGIAGGEGDGQPWLVEAVVREGLAVFRQVADAEARLVLEELELGEDAADGGGIGGPLDGRGDEPGVAALGEGEGVAGTAAGDFERADVRGLGPQDEGALLDVAGLDEPGALELEDEEEERDVQENEDEGDFGAHGEGKRSAINVQLSARLRWK